MGNKDYRNNAWLEFREDAFSKLGYFCQRCSRDDDEVTLQVHHKIYIDGRKPWEYNLSDCEILCSGCHAREHGHIRPDYNWNLSHSYDLGSMIGTCELCGNSIRFEFHVFHNDWHEPMVTGTVCCDYLTGTQEATEFRKQQQAFQRYLQKWCDFDNGESIYQANKRLTFKIIKLSEKSFKVEVIKLGKRVHIGKKAFQSAEEIKYKLHDYFRNKEFKNRFDIQD
ncbi:HNH endonuclease [Acinetobacter beijerinckii]|uniref:HNH endonuclease n=1 Tax=Acinetobacter beijerinckii TaxID=262668 RepID=UPI003AF4553A